MGLFFMTVKIIVLFIANVCVFECLGSFSDFYSEIERVVNASKTYSLPTSNEAFFPPDKNNQNYKTIDYGTYDFIIVGAGTAGGVLANRLTEEKFTVLVIEAGKEDSVVSEVLGLSQILYYSDWNWGYFTAPQSHACFAYQNRQCFYQRGKGLGGSSVINGGVYVRGNKKDYDKWETLGNVGWSFSDCLPYFKKPENAQFTTDIDKEFHGFSGSQKIGVPPDAPNLTVSYLNAFKELGLKEQDYNGQNQNVVSRTQLYVDYNVRTSTTQAFIKPVEHRTNLNITLESLVTKIKIFGRRAEGVYFERKGHRYFAKARKEVIVSAGAVNSPQLLMLSGIGPASELSKHRIGVIADLPVGKNLVDHLQFSMFYSTNQVYYNKSLLENLKLWGKAERPLNTVYEGHALSYWYTGKNDDVGPDIGIYGAQSTVKIPRGPRYTEEYKKSYATSLDPNKDLVIYIILLQPKSIGKITLKSKDPKDFPIIDPNYFSDTRDLDVMFQGVQTALKLNNTKSFINNQFRLKLPPLPNCDGKHRRLSKSWWYCALQHTATTLYHPIGTTRMGSDPKDSVVNSALKVHGFKNLRVVDAGVIPSMISGHINAPTVMLAEKIADVIKRDNIK